MLRLERQGIKNGRIDLWMTIAAAVIAVLMIVAATQAHAQTFLAPRWG
jgi:hypothetical protein